MKKPILIAFFISVALSFHAGPAGHALAANSGHTQKQRAPFKEIVFLDTSLPDHQTLMAGVSSRVEVILLDAESHGIVQISEALQGRDGLDAIHIVSHGSPGRLILGKSSLTAATMGGYGRELEAMGHALAESGDLLIYGCQVGAGPEGGTFIVHLAAATGADITASINATGASALGGDWELEATTGSIDVGLFADRTALETFETLLANDENFNGEAVGETSFGGSKAYGSFTFTGNGNTDIEIHDNTVGGSSSYLNTSNYLAYDGDAAAGITQVAFKTTDFSEFKLESFKIDTGLGVTAYTITGKQNGGGVYSATLNLGLASTSDGGATYTKQGGFNGQGEIVFTGWDELDELVMTGADLDTMIDDIDVSAAVLSTPTITSATYNAAAGLLVVTGTNLQANGGGADIEASKLTFTGEGGEIHTLTDSADVEIDSATQFTVTLSVADKAEVNQILNKNGTTSTDGTPYNLAAADDWNTNVTAGDTSDATEDGITVSNVAALSPSLTITKTPTDSQVDCGSQQSWTITVTNNGAGQAEVVRIEDTPGDWIDIRTGQPGDPIDMGGGVYGWEFNNLPASGGSQVLTLVGSLNPDGLPNQDDCAAALRQNNVSAIWACGTAGDAIDNDPTTTVDYTCENSSPANAPVATLQMPNLVVTSITPAVSCTSDGIFSGTISVRVTNNGDGDTSDTFTVEVTDGKGWTGTGTYGLAIASGGSADVTINTGTWTPDCQPCGAPYSFNATVDLNNDICECNETHNTTGDATDYTVPSPDLAVDSDALSVVCADDNQVTITGTVTLINNGCNTAVTSNIPMRFTLYDNTGCGGGVVEQWTDTFSSVNIAAGGGTQAFTIYNHTFTSNQCLDSTGCQVSIFVEADYNDSVCECDGTNNTYCADNIPVDIPDIAVDSDTLTVTCLDDGQVTVSGTVTLTNNGCGSNLNSNIPMRFTLYDNTGCAGNPLDQWTETFAGVNIASGGGTQVFAITPQTVTSDLVTNSTGCQVSIRVEADYNATICESDGTDNSLCSNKTVSIPDLRVNSVTPSVNCTADGTVSGTVTVNVGNIGCGDVVGAVVQLSSSCGSMTFVNQTVNLTTGSNSNLTFNYTPTPSTCTCDFTAVIDPGNLICESNKTNNSVTFSNYTPDIPDLEVTADTLSAGCSNDGEVSVTGGITVTNNGCGSFTSDIPVRFTLYDNTGCAGTELSTWTETLTNININGGGATQVIAISAYSVTTDLVANSSGCQVSIFVEADYNNSVCEFDGTNNTYCADNKNIHIPDLEVSSDTLGMTCLDPGQFRVSGNVTMVNNGCGVLTTDIPVRFTIYDDTGCAGSQVAQWAETLAGVNIAAGGGTQVFTIPSRDITSDLCSNATARQVSIHIEADFNDTICENDGTDNTYCAENKAVIIPWPLVTTNPVTGTRSHSATGNGTITNLGVPNPTAHGVVWNLGGGPDPTVDDNKTNEGPVGAVTLPYAFTSIMTGLDRSTAYAVRAYATDDKDTTYYGEVLTFTTRPISLPPVYYLLDEPEPEPGRR